MAHLLLATVNGQLMEMDTEHPDPRTVFATHQDNALMGLCQSGEHIYVAGLDRLYRLSEKNYTLQCRTRRYRRSPDFHQMNFYEGKLYTTATTRNQIWIYDKDLTRIRKVTIPPPDPERKIRYKKNYNHINAIVLRQNRFYINLNWLHKQYGDSGVLVTDRDFQEIEKFPFAWESHDFLFDGEKTPAICSTSSGDKQIRHPKRSGLMVEGELVWEHDPGESFCKGLCFDEQSIYVCGGRKAARSKRKNTAGIIYILDRNSFRLKKTIEHPKLKGIRGALVL
jgi:hypothetical protein